MRIAVIDDCSIDLKHLTRTLDLVENAEVLALDCLDDNLQHIVEHRTELVIIDDNLSPVVKAEDSLKTIARHFHNMPVLVIGGDVSPARKAELIRCGAFDCLEKDSINPETMNLVIAMGALKSAVFKFQGPKDKTNRTVS